MIPAEWPAPMTYKSEDPLLDRIWKTNISPDTFRALIRVMKAAKDYEQRHGLKGTSTHGNCCTCTTCKNYHDDCTCEFTEALKDVEYLR